MSVDTSSFWGIGRGGKKTPSSAKPERLSKIFARTVTGRHIRDIKFMLVGPQGSGKSRSLLYLASECAREIAAAVGGSPEDYFPSDLRNVVIGSPEGHAELFQTMRKHAIIVLDDAGVSMNARNFATSYNRSMNDCFQTMRPNRNIVLISTPDTMTTDVIVRTMVNYYGEVSESYHSEGYNLVKVFRVVRKYREGKTYYLYNQSGGRTIVRYKFANPPEDMIKTYEKKRFEATREIAARAGKEKEKTRIRPSVTCPHCKAVYTPRSSNPLRCAKCFRPLNKKKI